VQALRDLPYQGLEIQLHRANARTGHAIAAAVHSAQRDRAAC
jgi:hypothetical protein